MRHRHIFDKDRDYRVKKSFMSGDSVFVAGDLITFLSDGYSNYDNSFVFEFRSHGDGTSKTWWLHEDQSDALWRTLFEPADEVT